MPSYVAVAMTALAGEKGLGGTYPNLDYKTRNLGALARGALLFGRRVRQQSERHDHIGAGRGLPQTGLQD